MEAPRQRNAIDTRVTTLAANAESEFTFTRPTKSPSNGRRWCDWILTCRSGAIQRHNHQRSSSGVRQSLKISALTRTARSKFVAAAGTLTIKGGLDSSGVQAHGSGDILLQAVGAASDVVLDATVVSDTGNITLNASDDIDINAAVTTSGIGTIYATAANGTNNATATGA